MGCFNVNCPISGIPIEYETEVKWSIMLPSPLQSICYPTGSFQFLFPFFDGIYNDYGFVKRIKPDWYSTYVEKNVTKFYNIYPKDLINNDLGSLKIWMVRKDVFDYIIKKIPTSEELKKEVEFFMDSRDPDKGWIPSEKYWTISSMDGFLHTHAIDFLEELMIEKNKEINRDMSNRLLHSVRFTMALQLLCKSIQPVQLVTPDFNVKPYDDLIEFNKFITDKIVEIKYKYLDDLDDS